MRRKRMPDNGIGGVAMKGKHLIGIFILVLMGVMLATLAIAATNYINTFGSNLSFGTSDILFLDNTGGRIGLGIAAPAQQLHLSSAAPEIRFNDTDNPNWWDLGAESDDFKLALNDSSSDFLVIDQNGNIGLKTNPHHETILLSLVGNISMGSGDRAIGNNPDGVRLFSSGAAGGSATLFDSVGGDDEIAFRTLQGGVGAGERIRITASGNMCDQGVDADLGDCSSDARLKKNIIPYKRGLDIALRLNPVNYNWNEKAKEVYSYDQNVKSIGFVAQDVKGVLPDWVSIDRNGYYQVESGELQYILLNSVKELKKENEQLKSELRELKREVEER